ncbi:MAG: lipid-A-disaccharide synthase [Prevotella sp.]|nr:lipid-A-disaccharide synthase [Prevotella sp.]
MKYYLIVGEASGDLHASHLMQSLKAYDNEAEFRFFGGDLMTAEGGTRVKHFRELAYMGFIPVFLHLRTIFKNMDLCKKDISEWQPNAVILVDYPGFNLDIAKYVHNLKNTSERPKVFYYISPKIWAWKEYRIKRIKRDVDKLFSILPFEVPFYEQKHHYPIHYVGNPTADEVRKFRKEYQESFQTFCKRYSLSNKPIIALLAGSRKQEIKDNLPAMIQATADLTADYQLILAGAPSIEREYYEQYLGNAPVHLIDNDTYSLLSHAKAALVTSGTATLETALFQVPQVVCYETPVPRLIRFAFNHIIKVKYISLVNLIADREVVQELLADRFTVENIRRELRAILPGGDKRAQMLNDYRQVIDLLGNECAPDNAARLMTEKYLKIKKL